MQVIVDTNQSPHVINLTTAGSAQQLTAEQVTAWQRIKGFERSIRNHFPPTEANGFIGRLKSLADDALATGFQGPVWNEQFDTLRSDAVREGRRVRNDALLTRTKIMSIVALVGFFLLCAWLFWLKVRVPESNPDVQLIYKVVGATGYGSIGLALGSLASLYFANRVTDFDSLERLSAYGLTNILYVTYVYIVFFLVLIALVNGIVQISVAGIDTAAAINKPSNAFIVGLICGFMESKIVNSVTSALSKGFSS